jgi:hypothetical protein
MVVSLGTEHIPTMAIFAAVAAVFSGLWAAVRHCTPRWGNVLGGRRPGASFLDLSVEWQVEITRGIPLRDLAQLACISRDLRGVYARRVAQRDALTAVLVRTHFINQDRFQEGLTTDQTALPRDLIVQAQVRCPGPAFPCPNVDF